MLAAMLVPHEATKTVSDFMGTPDHSTPFVDETAALDRSLAQGFDIALPSVRVRELLPHVAVRRLATVGRLAADEVPTVLAVWAEFAEQEARESTLEGQRAVQRARHAALAARLPRFGAGLVERSLAELMAQAEGIEARDSREDASCQACHLQTQPTVGVIDTVGIWPHLPPDVFAGGIPMLSDAAEMRAFRPQTGCLSCHTAHGDPGFLTTLEERRESMGVWANVYRIEDLLYVQVKVQNKVAAHMVPGGRVDHAYAVVVDAYEGATPGGTRLPFWWGTKLPETLRTHDDQGGYLMGRALVDALGYASGVGEAVNVVADTRLEPDRFKDLTFLFEIPRDRYVPYSVVVRLVYLPDQMTMQNAQDVEVRIRASE